ncbi:MAG: hypothetical protein NTW93_01795 [Phycisphaerae bacterium]|nr:hypothetical protein [Phycisphaerae bacterium]
MKRHIIFIFLLILPVSSFGQTAKINLKTLIKICESYEKSITDVNMEYTFDINSVPPKNPPQNFGRFVGPQKCYLSAIKPFDQLYKSTMVIVSEDAKGNRVGATVTEACNGSIYMNTDGSIKNKKNLEYTGITPLGFTMFHQIGESKTLLDVLKNRSNYYTIVLDPNISKVNDFNAIKVTCTPYYGLIPQTTIKLFFSVDHHYTIIKIVLYCNGKLSYDVLQLKNLGKNIWFPTKANIINSDEGITNTFIVSKIAINQGITKNDLLQEQENKSSP